ncbi:superoxide dismutase [Candidatus Roizmanbacteria bacterium RIFCSPHIGHO2_01_FULL_39_12c]|uniref:superoxide dismutase n=1 Tax=Candidatus Roizmanbacteria bacterium RIFCSPHIGHO2_01_FULL_39_12c TaxID=1802031 RepID=A0A1F7GAV8_9BACT|nr:MAG: superoxide dismutase [Candidatus Roizmanbacteria bacterium RIFCSPHIGHO2_01_FULL_39_12c]
MNYEQKDFSYLLGTPGFSDVLLKNHFTLYQGYVINTNKLTELLKTTEPGTPAYNELKRRFGWEWNGMRLHELYFGNMKNGESPIIGEIKSIIEYMWGSLENWMKDFKATGAMRGIGWVILALDTEKKIVFNTWVNEHDSGHLAGCTPLLVMDVFEHAFMLDYGLKRADYIESFMKAIDWGEVNKRCK